MEETFQSNTLDWSSLVSSYSSSLPPTALHDFSAIYHPVFLKVGQMIDNDW